APRASRLIAVPYRSEATEPPLTPSTAIECAVTSILLCPLSGRSAHLMTRSSPGTFTAVFLPTSFTGGAVQSVRLMVAADAAPPRPIPRATPRVTYFVRFICWSLPSLCTRAGAHRTYARLSRPVLARAGRYPGAMRASARLRPHCPREEGARRGARGPAPDLAVAQVGIRRGLVREPRRCDVCAPRSLSARERAVWITRRSPAAPSR